MKLIRIWCSAGKKEGFVLKCISRSVVLVAVMASVLALQGCYDSSAHSGQGEANEALEENVTDPSEDSVRIQIELDEGEASRALASVMPFSLTMQDLNGNEKYVYLEQSLPADQNVSGRIEKGDVLLYGDSCIVVFYESFDTSYLYTRIGRVTNMDALEEIRTPQEVDVYFEVA